MARRRTLEVRDADLRFRTRRVPSEGPAFDAVGKQLMSSRSLYDVYGGWLNLETREHFIVLLLDGRNRVQSSPIVSVGTLTSSLVHPREVMTAAIIAKAVCFACVHNHPSGDPSPSRQDMDVTTRLGRCGELLGIPLIDHVIVASSTYFSFADHGLLDTQQWKREVMDGHFGPIPDPPAAP